MEVLEEPSLLEALPPEVLGVFARRFLGFHDQQAIAAAFPNLAWLRPDAHVFYVSKSKIYNDDTNVYLMEDFVATFPLEEVRLVVSWAGAARSAAVTAEFSCVSSRNLQEMRFEEAAMALEEGRREEMVFKVGNKAQEEVKMTLVLMDAIEHFQEAQVMHSASFELDFSSLLAA